MENMKVSAKKPDGKWQNYGTVKKNDYGNLRLSFKNTPEFKKLVNEGGDWLNFSLFPDKPKTVDAETQQGLDAIYDDNSTIPF